MKHFHWLVVVEMKQRKVSFRKTVRGCYAGWRMAATWMQ